MIKEIREFVEELATTEVTQNVYNQYSYESPENAIRRDNLLIYLEQMSKLKPKMILVGEAPGYRGCRLTGVPFTSDNLLMKNIEGLNLFGEDKGYKLAIKGDKLLKEATATIIWNTLVHFDLMILSWNAFPFHPYKQGNLESNRTPLKKELLIGEKPLLRLIEMFNIEKVIAVGNKAEESLNKLGFNCEKVRHPAQGGKNEFVDGIRLLKECISK
jgi:uracil-DNA glycosylase